MLRHFWPPDISSFKMTFLNECKPMSADSRNPSRWYSLTLNYKWRLQSWNMLVFAACTSQMGWWSCFRLGIKVALYFSKAEERVTTGPPCAEERTTLLGDARVIFEAFSDSSDYELGPLFDVSLINSISAAITNEVLMRFKRLAQMPTEPLPSGSLKFLVDVLVVFRSNSIDLFVIHLLYAKSVFHPEQYFC